MHNKAFIVNNSQSSDVLYTKTRVICRSNLYNGCSSNWRADWPRILGRTYAEVVSSNPSSSVYIDSNKVKLTTKSSVTGSCRIKQTNRPTCLPDRSVTGQYKTQRPGTVKKQSVSGYRHSSARFCIPVTNRFESLSVPNENIAGIQIENGNVNSIPNYSHLKNESSEFESSNMIESQCVDSSVMNLSNTSTQRCVNRQRSNTGTWWKKVNIDHKQSIYVGNNSEPLSQNSTSKTIQEVDQKHVKMCPKNYPPEDKYELALAVKNKNKKKLQGASSDSTYQKWSDQNQQKFGFIPLGPLLLPKNNFQRVIGTDPIKVYDITKNSDTFNFMSSQIQVKSQLNPDVWEQCLKGYWDSQLCYLIRYGFPLDFNRTSKLGKNTIVGPFSDPPCRNFIFPHL